MTSQTLILREQNVVAGYRVQSAVAVYSFIILYVSVFLNFNRFHAYHIVLIILFIYQCF